MAEDSDLTKQFRNELMANIGDISIHWFQPKSSSRAILYTKGMQAFNQHELAGKTDQVYPFIELYFLLPSHWDLEKENQKWPLAVLERMINAQQNQKVWYGPGDTLTAHPKRETIAEPINSIFKQNHFILTEPLAAEPILSEAINENEDVKWLGLIPIYQKEFDYKTSRSALELLMKFDKKNISELIDEHRPIAAKRRFFGLF